VVNHFGVAVDNVDKASEWYGKHLGFRRIRRDRTTDRDVDDTNSPIFKIYGDKLNKVKVAWLSTGNGVGFEIFEFIDPPTEKAEEIKKDWSLEQQYRRGGYFHLGITAPDPEAVAEKACEDGAVQIGETVDLYDGDKALYLRDPWGNVVEILSCSYEQLMGNRE